MGGGIKKYIQTFVRGCQVFQNNKGEIVNPPWLLQPLHIPSQIWEVISIDFIKNLQKSKVRMSFLWSWSDSQNTNIFVEFKIHILQTKWKICSQIKFIEFMDLLKQ